MFGLKFITNLSFGSALPSTIEQPFATELLYDILWNLGRACPGLWHQSQEINHWSPYISLNFVRWP